MSHKLTFKLTGATLSVESMNSTTENQELSFFITCVGPTAFNNSKRENLTSAHWEMHISRGPSQITKSDEDPAKRQGTVSYSSSENYDDRDYNVCEINTELNEVTFDSLVSSLQRGLIPSELSINVVGLQRKPVGVVWETQKVEQLLIESICFDILLFREDKSSKRPG